MSKKERILLTMLELIVKKGFHAIPMSLIAKESNIAVGTIYHYFKDKTDILETLYRMIRKDFGMVLKQDSIDKTPKEIFKCYWMGLYQYYSSNPMVFHFYNQIAPPLISKSLFIETRGYYKEHLKFIELGIEKKVLKKMNTDLFVRLFHNTVASAVELHISDIIELNTVKLNEIIDAAWDALSCKQQIPIKHG